MNLPALCRVTASPKTRSHLPKSRRRSKHCQTTAAACCNQPLATAPARPDWLRFRGVSTVEVLVAGVLATTIMASTIPLYVRHQRLLSESGRERLAIEELANQAELLQAFPATDWEDAVKNLVPSAVCSRRLPGVRLDGMVSQTSLGTRAILRLRWNDAGRRDNPLTLAVWQAGPVPDGELP